MKTARQRPRHFSGFTLVELLVTVAVLLGLAAIAGTSAQMLIERARVVESSANLRSLAIANVTYVADHGCYCPAYDQFNNRRWHGSRSSAGAKFDPTSGFLSPYLGKSMRVTACPLFTAIVTGSSSFEDGSGGYGYNSAYIGGRPGGAIDPQTKILISESTANVPNPGRTIMFTTTAYALPGGLQESADCMPRFPDYGSGPVGTKLSPTVHFRAGGRALVTWCDGSVTAELKTPSSPGTNPHGGDAQKWNLGWCGPEENNGWWNPRN